MLVVFMCQKRMKNKRYKDIQLDHEYGDDDVMKTLLRSNSSDEDLFDSAQDFVPTTIEEYKGH